MVEPVGTPAMSGGAMLRLAERLQAQPELAARIDLILAIVEDAAGEVETADEAERRALEAVRQLGNEVLHAWARGRHAQTAAAAAREAGVRRKEKKTSPGTRSSAPSR